MKEFQWPFAAPAFWVIQYVPYHPLDERLQEQNGRVTMLERRKTIIIIFRKIRGKKKGQWGFLVVKKQKSDETFSQCDTIKKVAVG